MSVAAVQFDLYSIDYLKTGSPRQRRAFESLSKLEIFPKLRSRLGDEIGLGEEPALAGSLPLDLALDESDLDIITYASDLKEFSRFLQNEFGTLEGFQSSRGIELGAATLMTKFRFCGEAYEIFTQTNLVPRQSSVIHLLVEARLLELGGASFRERVWGERLLGAKTEPAFGRVLGLEEPYRELLELEDLSDDELRARFNSCF